MSDPTAPTGDLDACAALVARGDPDRFATLMAAPVPARAALLPLYAFNVEVARAPWVTQEPMIVEMRLQWWRDVLEEIASGGPVRRHEVATPLADTLRRPAPDGAADRLSTAPALLDELVAARRRDTAQMPFDDPAALRAYLDATAGNLMVVAALLLGDAAQTPVRAIGRAHGLAQYLMAVPELEARGKAPLPDGRPDTLRALAREGRDWLAEGRAARLPKQVRPALWPAWQADAILKRAAAHPARVGQGALAPSEFSRRFGLLRRGLTGAV